MEFIKAPYTGNICLYTDDSVQSLYVSTNLLVILFSDS